MCDFASVTTVLADDLADYLLKSQNQKKNLACNEQGPPNDEGTIFLRFRLYRHAMYLHYKW